MRIISDQKEFEVLCGELVHEPIIFMDTEFCRRRTYYAKLSLVQIATKEQKIIIDALAIQNITPLKGLLLNEKILALYFLLEAITINILLNLPINVKIDG
jgi:ribonuclease D